VKVGDVVGYIHKKFPKDTRGIILDIKGKKVRVQWANHPSGPAASLVEENKASLETKR
jgi:hypothetical protein